MHKHRRTTHTSTVSFWRAGSAASVLRPVDMPAELIEHADLVHLTGILPGPRESAAECALEVARTARRVGIRISFDVNHRSKVWGERNPNPV
ncbi:sugar/nucleoside kinase (ribokinase family) [Microbacterium testaceum]|nr:sugar/nucleoside kinase (ribokinase family) [Microbacterium sp. SORGH_AS_0969]MDQ1115179.1 sugar/nucleoside kinase (ribokinase family) [Microbacterium testaceum]